MLEIGIVGLAAIIFYIYQLILFDYVGKILKNSSKNKIVHMVLSGINTCTVFLVGEMTDSMAWRYIALIILLILEMKIVSRAHWRQILFIVTSFLLLIIIFYTLSISIMVTIVDVGAKELLENPIAANSILIVSFTAVTIAVQIIKAKLETADMKRISLISPYVYMMIFVILVLLVYLHFNALFVLNYGNFIGMLTLAIATSVVSLVIVLIVLLYTVDFIKLNQYRRKVDKVSKTYARILDEKKHMTAKVNIDAFTKLYNRKFVYDLLNKYFQENIFGFSIVYIDANELKFVNDNYGHQAGDKFLQYIARTIKEEIREDDIAGKIGGDEFLLILNETNEIGMNIVLKRIEKKVNAYGLLVDFPMSLSMGGVWVDETLSKEGLEKILEIADKKMRKEKEKFYREES